MHSYLHNNSGDTHYSDRACPIQFDEFSAPRHGDVVIVRTFVLWVLSCKSLFHVGIIRKTILTNLAVLATRLQECLF
jgi:hypothetical protein